MKYDVTFTEQAENDLRGIFEYIALDLLSHENAAGKPNLQKTLWRCEHVHYRRKTGGSLR